MRQLVTPALPHSPPPPAHPQAVVRVLECLLALRGCREGLQVRALDAADFFVEEPEEEAAEAAAPTTDDPS